MKPEKCPYCGEEKGVIFYEGAYWCGYCDLFIEEANTKKVECAHCGKEVEVPDDINPDEIAVFCSTRCSYTEAGW